jgi:hypothetical protein
METADRHWCIRVMHQTTTYSHSRLNGINHISYKSTQNINAIDNTQMQQEQEQSGTVDELL